MRDRLVVMPSNTTARSKSIRTTNESLSRGAIWQSLDPRSIPARATFAPPEGMPALTRTNIRRQGPTRISPEFSTAFAGVHAYFSGICRLAAFCSVTPRAESLRSTCGTRGALVQERDRNQGRRPLPKAIVATWKVLGWIRQSLGSRPHCPDRWNCRSADPR